MTPATQKLFDIAIALQAEGKTERESSRALFNTKGARVAQIKAAMAALDAHKEQ